MDYNPKFQEYSCPSDYENDGVLFLNPMLAKEIETDEEQDKCFESTDYYIEEKFDGTRALMHFNGATKSCRIFSRRISKKTDWFCENTDSLPHLRELYTDLLDGTVLDGEMFIPDRPFSDVSGTLNCKYDEAISRQEKLGFIVFHVFDILYYGGKDVQNKSLEKRKEYIFNVVNSIGSSYICPVPFFECGKGRTIPVKNDLHLKGVDKRLYPNLFSDIFSQKFACKEKLLSPRAYYEYIVHKGGEGVIVKPKSGLYKQKRGWEYSKIKKFLSREVIIIGYNPPEREYTGKFSTMDKWDYWETPEGDIVDLSGFSAPQRESFKKSWYSSSIVPVTRYFYNGWIGTVIYGVILTDEEQKNLPSNKKFNVHNMNIEGVAYNVVEVGECSGFDDSMRKHISDNRDSLVGKVIEVKANEIFKDTGKFRHPIFLRFREDKSPVECTWANHIS